MNLHLIAYFEKYREFTISFRNLNLFFILLISDSDSDYTPQPESKEILTKEPRNQDRILDRILTNISHPPAPVSPLSSSSSTASPVRGRSKLSRNSSRSSSRLSSSPPRSVIKTPSPLPTNQERHISSNSSSDVEKREEMVKPATQRKSATGGRKRQHEARKSKLKQKSPYISASDSESETKQEETRSKAKSKNTANSNSKQHIQTGASQSHIKFSESCKAMSKKRLTSKEVRSRSISSSHSSSPSRPPVNVSPTKAQLKRNHKKGSVRSSFTSVSEKDRGQLMNHSTNVNFSTRLTGTSPTVPRPISPLGDSLPLSPIYDSFHHNYSEGVETENNSNDQQQMENDFLQPLHPSRALKRPHERSPTNTLTHRPHENVHDDLKYMPYNGKDTSSMEENLQGINEKTHKDAHNYANSLDDVNYYPVQADHKEFIPIGEFKNVDYVNLLLSIEVSLFPIYHFGAIQKSRLKIFVCKNVLLIIKYIFRSNILSQARMANPQPGDNIDEVVELIQQTGCWDVQNNEFVFDLGLIEKKTIKKITKVLFKY